MRQQTSDIPVNTNPLGYEKIGKLIWKFSTPAVISMLVNAIYNMVDQIFIGHSDVGFFGIAATNVAFPITTLCVALSLLIGVGGASNLSLRLGEGNSEEARHTTGNVLSYLTIIGTVLCAIVLIFLRPLMGSFGATQAVMPLAASYTAIIAPGIPFLIFSTGACTLIRADGSPKYAMLCMTAGAIFNLVFDPIFLYVFKMGIEGIALATTLGQVLSTALALIYIIRGFRTVPLKRRHFKPNLTVLKTVCTLGMAHCFNQLAMMVVQIVMNNTLRYYGSISDYGSDIPLAAVGAISKLAMIMFSFTIGIGQGCQPIWGFNYGAKQYGRVKQTLRYAIISSCIISVLGFIIFQLFPAQLMTLFGEDGELYLRFSVRFMRVFMLLAFVNGVQPVTANFFTSIGKARKGILISLTRQIIFILPLIIILPIFTGIDGLMMAAPIADGAAAILSAILIAHEVRILNRMQLNPEGG